jgi:hypothetical protein
MKVDLFDDLTPPPGGLAALRERLGRDPAQRRRRAQRLQWAMAACAAMIGFGVAVSPVGPYRITLFDPPPSPAPKPTVPRSTHPGMVALGFEPAPAAPVTVLPGSERELAVTRTPTPDDDVIIYMVASVR